MIIKALRVADLGPFATGVALEQLSGRLDVLVGANEAGKSSLFSALLTLVEEPYTATGTRIARLRHAGSGAPLIEADLLIGGRRIRVRKRYLAQRQAVVEDLDNGQTQRGADAEARLEQLLSPHGLGNAPRRLLWIAQGHSFDPAPALETKKDKEDVPGALARLIEREAAETTNAGLTRRVAAAIAADLARLQTAHTPPRPTGPLKAAREAHAAAKAARDAARDAATGSAARREQLADLRREEESLSSAESHALLQRAASDARRAHAEAVRAREQLVRAAEKLVAARQLEEAAVGTLADLERRRAMLSTIAGEIETAATERGLAQTRRAEAQTRLADLEARRAALSTALDQVRANRKARKAADARQALAELTGRAAAATDAARQIAGLEADAAADRVRGPIVADARRLQNEIARCEAQSRAASARIDITYEAGTGTRIHVAGRPLADGETLLAQQPLMLTIPGIGTVRVLPGQTGSADLSAQAQALRESLQTMLGEIGVADLEAADAALQAAARRAELLAGARARLTALAPAGVDRIVQELDRLHALAAAEPDTPAVDVPPLADIERDVAMLEAERAALEHDLDTARALAGTTAQYLVAIEASIEGRRNSLAVLTTELGEDPATRHAEFAAAASAARTAHTDARREHGDWTARAPDAAGLARLEADVERATAAEAGRDARLLALRQAIAKLEGELGRDDQDGIGAELMRLDDQVVEAAMHLAEVERETAALSLLGARLQTAQTLHRGTALRPLAERLTPLLERLLPETTTELSGPTGIDSIVRRGRPEPFAQLSDGTREQIAVLVRLAWARLLAEQGHAAPVVLDDPLVYSDDERLTRMFQMLADAAHRHQVLVLSCHASATLSAATKVGAHMLTLQPWKGEDVRAA